MTKTCSTCAEAKPATLEYFAPESRVGDGLTARCRACKKARRDPAAELARVQRWYAQNKPAAQRRSRRWYDTHRAEKARYDRDRYELQRDRILPRARVTGRLWRARNLERLRLSEQRRRARKAAVLNDLTAAQWAEIVAYFGGWCAYCLQPVPSPTIDHLRPISRGGSHTATNVVPACGPCNSSKGAKSLLASLR